MSFQFVPSLFRIPTVPGIDFTNAFWRGKGGDEGLFSFYNATWGGHIIVEDPNFCFNLELDGNVYTPVFTDINGYIYWEGSGYIYYSQSYGWVWTRMFPGYEPFENYKWEDDEAVWEGDDFYTLSSLPNGPGKTVTMQPAGSNREKGEAKEVKAIWPRWVAKSGEFGIYEGKDGESGEKVKGIPRFKGNGEYFIRSLNKENGYFTYGRIRNSGGKWIIGEQGSYGGWHEGSEPNVGGSVTFKFTKPQGSDATGENISVSFDTYIAGDETDTAYLGSVAVWR